MFPRNPYKFIQLSLFCFSYLRGVADILQRQVSQSGSYAVRQTGAPVGRRRRHGGGARLASSSLLRVRQWPQSRRNAEQQQGEDGARRGLRAVQGIEPVEAPPSGVRCGREPLLEHALRQVGRVDAGGARGDCQSVGER